jgi:hypothetical protein
MQETAQQYTQRILSYSEAGEAIQLLESAPKKFASLLTGKGDQQLTRRPAPERWSAAEIAAHVSDVEIAVSWRIRQILGRNTVHTQAFDQDAWARTFDYAHRDPNASLELFRVLRGSNLALLKSVPRELWQNYGVHEERGNESIEHMVRLLAGHDLNHLRQIEEIFRA